MDRQPRMVEVAQVNERGRLVVLRLEAHTLHYARAHGWMVWDDFEKLIATPTSPQGDGDDGA